MTDHVTTAAPPSTRQRIYMRAMDISFRQAAKLTMEANMLGPDYPNAKAVLRREANDLHIASRAYYLQAEAVLRYGPTAS